MLIKSLLLVSILTELLMYLSPLFWRVRKLFVYIISGLIGFSLIYLLVNSYNVIYMLIGAICLFRLINLARITEKRMHESYLLQATRRSSFWLCGAQLILLLFIFTVSYNITFTSLAFLRFSSVIQLVSGTAVFLLSIINTIRASRTKNTEHFSDKELPSVTVAIPARNETSDLEACISSILLSDYPKLEILVLDDCSQLRTSEIIKSYAHDGVRFIKGSAPNEHWLAKNQAYQRLASEATGKYILFCGVDARVGKESIREAITYLLNNNLNMISVLPKRQSKATQSSLIQPMRYWWELVLPRFIFGRPPVLSTCWIICAEKLNQCGGFAGVSHSILPEAYFASVLSKTKQYKFIRSDNDLNIQSLKSFDEQRETAIRMRYPQLHRRPEMVLLVSIINYYLLLGPFILLIISLVIHDSYILYFSLAAAVFGTMTHMLIIAITNPTNLPMSFVDYPLALITEMILGYISMWRYEFSVVNWKGRNICIPVMHVIARLPQV